MSRVLLGLTPVHRISEMIPATARFLRFAQSEPACILTENDDASARTNVAVRYAVKGNSLMSVSTQAAKVVEQTTREFREDLKRLDPARRAELDDVLRNSYDLLQNDRRGFFARARRPLPIHLKGGLNPSLYSLRVGREARLIMAVDDDPVFGQTLVTLFRLVSRSELEHAYRLTAAFLYGNQLDRNGKAR